MRATIYAAARGGATADARGGGAQLEAGHDTVRRVGAAGEDHMAQQAKIACLIGDGFEDSEFRVPYDRLRGAGYGVELIGAKAGQEVKGKAGRETVKTDKAAGDVRVDDYVALLIPGGYSPDHLRIDRSCVELVKRFEAAGKLIAAVCHGPQLLITAGLVRGRTLTAWPTIQEDLRQVGANVKDQQVVVDRNWVTSRKPDDLTAFSDAILQQLGHGAAARQGETEAGAHP